MPSLPWSAGCRPPINPAPCCCYSNMGRSTDPDWNATADSMKILAIHDTVVPIGSAIRNAYIDFSQMTASVVAIVTNVRRDGKRVVGFGFTSNGRYAPSGLLRERFIPRLKSAKAETLLDAKDLIDPFKAWDAMMANEKPGGHGERSVAVGVLDMALWDAVAKAEGVSLWQLLATRYRGVPADERAWVYAAGGYYYPGKDIEQLQAEMRSYRARLCLRQDEDRRRRSRRRPAPHRGGARDRRRPRGPRRRRQWPLR